MQALFSILNLLLAHVAISFEYFFASAVLLSIALSGLMSLYFCQRAWCKTSFYIAGVSLTGFLVIFLDARLITYFPPLLIHFFLFLFFSSSLISGNQPIITRFARLINGELSAKEKDYTRKATIAWSMFLFFLFTEAMVIAFLAPIHIWSLFVNFINYLFLLVMFIAEFLVRQLVFKEEGKASFPAFIKSLTKVDMKKIISKG